MLRCILAVNFILLTLSICSQSRDNYWYFGENAGLNFDNGFPTAIFDGSLNTVEGCATISSPDGNLLFYTDGISVFNKNHTTMSNGNGLGGNQSSTHSAIILPKPNSDSIYYVFTTDANGGMNGMQYSEVDMSLSNGLGSITETKNIQLALSTDEKLVGIGNESNDGYWVIAHKFNSDQFLAYSVSSEGVSLNPVVSAVGSYTDITNRIGQIKASPNGNKIALARGQEIQIYDFDKATGVISNPVTISDNVNFYGIEFSPSGALVYASYFVDALSFEGGVNQYNIFAGTQQDIVNSKIILTTPDNSGFGALQLGPDDKIYVAKISSPFLDVILNPNLLAADSNYMAEGIDLQGFNGNFGLPTFVKSTFNIDFEYEQGCNGNIVNFYPNISGDYDSIKWDFGNDNFDYSETPSFQFESSTEYNVKLTVTSGINSSTITKEIYVHQTLDINEIDIDQCSIESNSDFSIFNLNNYIDNMLVNLNEDTRDIIEIRFFEDINLENEIYGQNYQNISNPQIIYANLYNPISMCSVVGEITLKVNDSYPLEISITGCEQENGYAIFDLNDATEEINVFYPNNNFVIEYFENQENALLGVSHLNDIYQLSLPFNQFLYAKISNYSECLSLVKIELNVDNIAIANQYDYLFLCANDIENGTILDAGVNDILNNYTYLWSNGETTSQIQINNFGNYTVNVINDRGCSVTRTIDVLPSSVADIDEIIISSSGLNNEVIAEVSGYGDYIYSLEGSSNFQYQISNVFQNVLPGNYTLNVKDIKADCGVVSEDFSILGFSKFFTPNNDSNNDTWKLLGINHLQSEPIMVKIFDRYGKILKVIKSNNPTWDGNYNGQPLPTDDYWFVAKLVDGREFRGHFTLKR